MMTFPIYGKIKNVPNHQPDGAFWLNQSAPIARWMVDFMLNPIEIDDDWGYLYDLGNLHISVFVRLSMYLCIYVSIVSVYLSIGPTLVS